LKNNKTFKKLIMKKILRTGFIAVMLLLALKQNCFSQTTIITGRVNSEDGQPLSGVTVSQKNSKVATTTNADGYFSIKVNSGTILIFTSVSYSPKEIAASSNMEVSLSLKRGELAEVQVTVDKGYGKSKRLAVSSSIASVSGKEISNQPAYNVGTLLQGRATGVQVTNTSGGFPKILIRGFTSLNTNTNPLIIMDGINLGRANLNLVNINDIETIDILKDGAAAAIYGTDASGGVIVITTKKGKTGKLQAEATVNYGNEYYDNPNLADGSEYLEVQKRRNPGYTVPTWATNTDWWGTIVKPTNVINASVNLSGGTDKMTSFSSLSYYRTEGPLPNEFTQRGTARFNVDYKVSKYFSAGATVNPRVENWKNNGIGDLMPLLRTEPILPIFVTRPGQNIYSQYSSTFIERNTQPLAQLARSKENFNYFIALIGDVHFDISPVKNLTIRAQYGMNAGNGFSRSYSPPFHNNAFGARSANYDSVPGNTIQTTDNYNYASRASSSASYNVDYRSTYTANYGLSIAKNHKVNLLAGYEIRKESGSGTNVTRAYISVDQPGLWNPNNAGTPVLATSPTNFISAGGGRYNETWLSYFGRLNYEFNNKYFLEGTIRKDGSSRFPESQKFGYFPSVSGSWIVTRERFMSNIKPLSFLKLRAGYGSVGNASFNDPSVGLDLLSRSVGEGNNYVAFGGAASGVLSLGRPGNPNLIWETTNDVNFGVESYWLKNRLYINFDVYDKKSKDVLFNDNLGRPDLGIAAGSWYNLGILQVKGFEGVVGYKDKTKSGLSYDVSVNFSRNRVFLNSLGTNNAPIFGGAQGAYRINEDLGGSTVFIEKKGGQIGNFYGLQVLGVFQNWFEINAHTDKNGNKIQPRAVPGDFKFEDLNKDGLINENDKKILGNAYPKIEIGTNIRLEYRGVDLAVNGYGRFGHKVFWVAKKWFVGGALGSNVFKGSIDKAWNGEGSTNSYPRLINDAGDANSNLKTSNSWFVENGDYYRINNLQLGYTLTPRLSNKVGINGLRLFVNLQNIVTFTKYQGFNPEIYNQDFGVVSPGFDLSQQPLRKSVSIGLSLKF
jgi:TonB-dependent starch-binding outer membrane protein SusC